MQGIRFIGCSVLVAGLAFAVTPARAKSPSAGPKAPPFQPNQWVNQKGPVPASAFQGRLVLVEKWATWCGPCVANIPHLNELTDKFGKKGLTIVGITMEPPAEVKPFVEKKGIKYMIGSGGADGYVTRAIPHAWLVSPKGRIVWEGYPSDLKVDQIQEHLKDVVLPPQFELPGKLKDAEHALNAGSFGDGLRLLNEHADAADRELAGIARNAADRVVAYGKERLQEAENLIRRDEYGNAARVLTDLMTSFTGTEIADYAREREAALRKDPRIGIELEGEELLARADALVAENRPRQAAALVVEQITRSKKYENSKVREKAQQLLASTGQTARQ